MAQGALEGERTLTMMVPPLFATRGASGWAASGEWSGTGTDDILTFSGYIDCSGYTNDGLTLFPLGVTLQDPGRYVLSSAVPPNVVPLLVIDIITTEVLSSSDVLSWANSGMMPGMLGTTHDWTQIQWGQYRTFLGQASYQENQTQYLAADHSLFGSGEPSTADKLHFYRFAIMPTSAINDTLGIPASRFVVNAIIAEEKELAFLMRQKRSYELAT